MKKLLAMLLSVLLLVSCCAVAVSAEDDNMFNDVEISWDDDDRFNDDELDWGDYLGKFEIGSADAVVGETVTIPVSITKNPGIISLKLAVNYDAAVLELVSVEGGDFGSTEGEVPGLSFGPMESNPFMINWIDPLSQTNNVDIGTIAYLTFKVKEDAAEGSTDLSITFNPNDVFDFGSENVEFTTVDGAINVTSAIVPPANMPGDVNGDGKVNVRDLGVMQQYINGWNVNIDLDAADVNDDGKVNVRDLGLMQQSINGWDVILK